MVKLSTNRNCSPIVYVSGQYNNSLQKTGARMANVKRRGTRFYLCPTPLIHPKRTQCAQNCWRSEWSETRQRPGCTQNSKHINGRCRALNAIQETFFLRPLDIYLITPAAQHIQAAKKLLFHTHKNLRKRDGRFIKFGRRTRACTAALCIYLPLDEICTNQ